VVEDAWVAVRGARIAEVGSGAVPARYQQAARVDLEGRTLIPGLVDAHTHPWAVPGADLRGEDEATRLAARKQGLRAYLACGVTTVLDAGSPWEAGEAMRAWLSAGEPGPRLLSLGPVVGPPGGYVEAFLPGHPGVGSVEAARAHLDRLAATGAAGVKLTIEPGYFLPVLPLHAPALQEAIAAEAAARDLPLYVHAQHREAALRALELQPHALLHMVRDRPGELPARLAAAGVPLVSTLNIEAAPLLHFDPRPLDAPLARLVVPPAQRETALGAASWRAFRRGMAAVSLPHSAPWFQRVAAAALPTQDYLRRARRVALANARRMREAGVRLVLGSDAGAYDAMPFYFHGWSSLSELALLVEAGSSPEEALLAGTRDAAALLGLSGRVGVVAAGADADLVVLDGDPLVDPLALRAVRYTMRGGELRTPEGWMRGPARADAPGDAPDVPLPGEAAP
jgi:imidazolonepropionase-like amidohydrolase